MTQEVKNIIVNETRSGDRGQAHLGQAHLLNKETVDKRQQHEADKQFEKQFKSMCHLGPSLFAETKTRDLERRVSRMWELSEGVV